MVTATFCLETPAFGRGRVAFGDRQKVAVTICPPGRNGPPNGLGVPGMAN
jgi:hypothetical protein